MRGITEELCLRLNAIYCNIVKYGVLKGVSMLLKSNFCLKFLFFSELTINDIERCFLNLQIVLAVTSSGFCIMAIFFPSNAQLY